LEACRFQKLSLWSWLLGSVSTITQETTFLLDGSADIKREDGESDESWQQRKENLKAAIQRRVIVLVHAIFQVTCMPRS
jgi:hypothetical protein